MRIGRRKVARTKADPELFEFSCRILPLILQAEFSTNYSRDFSCLVPWETVRPEKFHQPALACSMQGDSLHQTRKGKGHKIRTGGSRQFWQWESGEKRSPSMLIQEFRDLQPDEVPEQHSEFALMSVSGGVQVLHIAVPCENFRCLEANMHPRPYSGLLAPSENLVAVMSRITFARCLLRDWIWGCRYRACRSRNSSDCVNESGLNALYG